MWFIVKTDVFMEQASIDLLREKYADTITDIYFPLARRTYTNEKGEEKVRFAPVLQGMFFVRAASEKRLMRILSKHGYFMYKGADYDVRTNELVERTFFARAHILCANTKKLSIGEIVSQARIPDEDMERFSYYNDNIADGIKGLTIVDKRYSDLVKENDTIRILSGPMAGWVGVVKQIKNKGKKDRHLLVRFGNNSCLCISNIRQYDMQIEHEAPSESVDAWRAIDQMIGYLQAKEPSENASKTLRRMFSDYQKKLTVYRNRNTSDVEYDKKTADKQIAHQQEILGNIDSSMRGNFRILAKYFQSDKASLEQGLNAMIPDAKLRPFLTPTSGIEIPQGKDYAVLQHNDITEFIFCCNLREFFRGKKYEADKYAPVFDEDYDYFAHFALFQTEEGKLKLICSWGDFYEYYASQGKLDREKFLADLEAKKYPRLLHLLTQSDYQCEKISGIGGFSIVTDVDYTDDIEELGRRTNEYFTANATLFSQLTAAAVEVWQGARLLIWRKLLQRHVLLHKVPIIDLPSVITLDPKLEEAFTKGDGKLDIEKVSAALAEAQEAIEKHLEKEETAYAIFRFLSTSLVLSSHFAKDELYNHLTPTFAPDQTLTALFSKIKEKLPNTPATTVTHLHKGMQELQSQDSWTYFKFPSFLKQTKRKSKKG